MVTNRYHPGFPTTGEANHIESSMLLNVDDEEDSKIKHMGIGSSANQSVIVCFLWLD